MNLSNKQERNLNCILLYCLNEKNKKYEVLSSSQVNEQIQITFIRKISISELEEINEYLKSNIKNKKLIYKVIITPKMVDIFLDQPEFKQISLFDNIYDNDKLNKYNKMLISRLDNVKDLLINTFFEKDQNIQEWIYFFIAPTYIGYANDDTYCPFCIKGDSNEIPKNAYVLNGTYNDAQCILLRRNQNSNYYGNWNTIPNDVCYLKQFLNNVKN